MDLTIATIAHKVLPA